MKKTLYLFIILLPFTIFGQSKYWARLSIYGSFSNIGISPSEEIWIATRAGNVYYTKQIGELWHNGGLGSINTYNSITAHSFDRIDFFSEDTFMISGFIQENRRKNFILWSGDKGKSYEKVVFGEDCYIDATCVNNNGKGWMSGSSRLIYYTEDKGKTWTSFDNVEPTGNFRFSSIHFAKDEQTGLFGTNKDALYRTFDNCQSWEELPTPLNQGKYKKISKSDRHGIRKGRIFGKYYIVKQQGRINWQ